MFDQVSSIANLIQTGVDKIFPDADQESKNELTKLVLEIQSHTKIIKEETSGNHIQRSWRPVLMLAITAIIVNTYLIFPYLLSMGFRVLIPEIPDKMWILLTIGVGGYIGGRSWEKVSIHKKG
jgi:hypothetical protein